MNYIHTRDDAQVPRCIEKLVGYGSPVYLYLHPRGGWLITNEPISLRELASIAKEEDHENLPTRYSSSDK